MIQLVLAMLAVPGFAFAAAPQMYDIALKLKAHGKEIASPSVVVMEGETARITQHDEGGTTDWEVLAQSQANNQVMLSFKIGVTDKDGTQKILSQPRIMAMENERAEISVGDANGVERLSLQVIAKKKSY